MNNNFIDDIPVGLLAVAGVQQLTGILNPILMTLFYTASIVWLIVQIKHKLKNKDDN